MNVYEPLEGIVPLERKATWRQYITVTLNKGILWIIQ